MMQELSGWKTWQEFRSAQQEIVLPAGTAAHIPVTVRYVDVGEAQRGTIDARDTDVGVPLSRDYPAAGAFVLSGPHA